MPGNLPAIRILQGALQEHASPDTRAWWERYVKDGAPFLGVKMSAVRAVVHQWHRTHIQGHRSAHDQVDLALALFDGPTTEEKLAGTLYLGEILLPLGALSCGRELDRFAELFTGGRIYDWNVCDWFCVKVLGPLIQVHGPECASRIARWRGAENLWQARASLVAFVPVADHRAYHAEIADSCRTLIARKERFAKTAVGWILREISRHDEHCVRRIIEENIRHFSAESLKNATKFLSPEEQRRFNALRKQASRSDMSCADRPAA